MKRNIFLVFLLLIFIGYSHDSDAQGSPKIVDAIITWNNDGSNSNADLAVYLTDTISVIGIEVQIDSIVDGNGLYNQQFYITSLPGNSRVDETTLILDLGELEIAPNYYTWIKLQLSGSESEEIKIHASR